MTIVQEFPRSTESSSAEVEHREVEHREVEHREVEHREVEHRPVASMSGDGDAAELERTRRWIRQAADVCEQAAQGNLEARLLNVDVDGDLARVIHGINALLDNTDAFIREAKASLDYAAKEKFFRRVVLRGMAGTFRHASQLINSASEEMEQQSRAIADAMAEREMMADDFETTVSSIEGKVVESGDIVRRAVSEAEQASTVVAELNQSSTKIDTVVGAISRIAKQTNILAMNASIEAARAGEAGRAFAIVASEVKSLAQQTDEATQQVDCEVRRIQGGITEAVEAIVEFSATNWTVGLHQRLDFANRGRTESCNCRYQSECRRSGSENG